MPGPALDPEPEYRPVPESRLDDYRRLVRYAFDATSGPYDPDESIDERRRRMWSFGERRGMFAAGDENGTGDGSEDASEDASGELLACCAHIEFTARVRGAWLPMAGLSAVASGPDRRREGLVGRMLAASLAEYRDRGWPIAALRPFREAFYARYGWATGCRRTRATVEPAALATTRPAAAGTFRRVTPEEHERLAPAYAAWLDGVGLATRRSADWWRDRVFQGREHELFCYAWEREGDVRGYLLYDLRGEGDDRRLRVHELAHADHEAYLNLLRFCADHDSQVDEVELPGPGHDRLVDIVSDRDALEVTVAAGQMVRIVDVPAALTAVPYPGVDRAEVVLDVTDEHAGWNDATFALRVRDGEATVTEVGTETGGTDAAPDARADVGTLSQLLVGYRSVERARAAGGSSTGLTVETPAAADALDALFPPGESYLPERF